MFKYYETTQLWTKRGCLNTKSFHHCDTTFISVESKWEQVAGEDVQKPTNRNTLFFLSAAVQPQQS